MNIEKDYFIRYIRNLLFIISAIVVFDGVISTAFSQSLYSLFNGGGGGGGGACPPPALNRIFSGFLCEYEQMLDRIMNVVYTGMLQLMNAPFFAMLTLFVTCTGILFMSGIVPFSIRDFMLIMFKVMLVMVFATNPAYMIDYLYVGVVTFAQGTTDAILGVVAPAQGNIQGIFAWIDSVFFEFLRGQGENATSAPGSNGICENNLLALLFGLAITMPPLFGIAVYVLLQMAFSFFKTIMSYVIAMTGIMFLSAMSPLFFTFALFKFTSGYFENWLKYLITFAVQIFVIFAFVGVVISLLSSPNFVDRKNNVLAMIQPYDKTMVHDGHRLDFNSWCSLCIRNAGGGSRSSACSGEPLSPTNLMTGGGTEDLLNFIVSDLFYIGLLAYILNILLVAAPEISRALVSQLGAPQYSGELPLGRPSANSSDQDQLANTLNKRNGTNNPANVGNTFSSLIGNRPN
jgi:hypothetical protein